MMEVVVMMGVEGYRRCNQDGGKRRTAEHDAFVLRLHVWMSMHVLSASMHVQESTVAVVRQ